MNLYSKNGNYPTEIPDRIRLKNGLTRTNKSTFTDEEIENAGYVKVSPPPLYEHPNVLDWDGHNMQWVVRPPNEQELTQKWQEIKAMCETMLVKTDYKVTKAIERSYINGTSIAQELDPEYVIYRQKLRDIYNNVGNIDPWNVKWPDPPQS